MLLRYEQPLKYSLYAYLSIITLLHILCDGQLPEENSKSVLSSSAVLLKSSGRDLGIPNDVRMRRICCQHSRLKDLTRVEDSNDLQRELRTHRLSESILWSCACRYIRYRREPILQIQVSQVEPEEKARKKEKQAKGRSRIVLIRSFRGAAQVEACTTKRGDSLAILHSLTQLLADGFKNFLRQ